MKLVKILRQTKTNILIVMNATNILCLKNTWLDTHENKAHCMAKERPVKGDDDGLEEDGKQVFWLKKAYRSVLPLLHQTYWKSVHKA